MNFHSLAYIVFLLAVLAGYWCLRPRWQNWFLIPASLLFYGWVQPWFLLPFAATTVIDYFVARGIAAAPARKRALVAVSVVSNFALLGVFKYFNFFVANVSALLDTLHLHVPLPVLHVVLPAGISFYTFQSIGYVVDVSRGHIPACRSFRDYALFVAFFPQLVAGPIQRAGHLLTQIQRPRTLTPAVAADALFLLVWGFFKKVVIADNVAVTANKVFALADPSFPILWTGVLAFCIQIYADFSAYTDIARGTARLLGFDLSPNFNHPYLADSPSDFWRRWHISLSAWIRDYVFIPLGGSRGGTGRTLLNLTIIFLLTGLWHGASWNFVLWGLYYAVLTIVYRLAASVVPAVLQTLPGLRTGRILLMFALTNLGWLIFREQNIAHLWRDLILRPGAASPGDWHVAAYLTATTAIYTLPLLLHIIWTPPSARSSRAGMAGPAWPAGSPRPPPSCSSPASSSCAATPRRTSFTSSSKAPAPAAGRCENGKGAASFQPPTHGCAQRPILSARAPPRGPKAVSSRAWLAVRKGDVTRAILPAVAWRRRGVRGQDCPRYAGARGGS